LFKPDAHMVKVYVYDVVAIAAGVLPNC